MKLRQLGLSGLDVSEIGLGAMNFGDPLDKTAAFRQLDFAFDHGVNLIDTAETYPAPPSEQTHGLSEQIIGSWLHQKRCREQIVIASKAAGPSAHLPYVRGGGFKHDQQSLYDAAEGSLRRLKTDTIDLFQLHWPDRATNFFGQLGYKPAQRDASPDLEATLRALTSLVAAGKVRCVGVCNETPWGLMRFLGIAEREGLPIIAAIQNPYNLLNRVLEIGLAEIIHRERVGLIAYSPLAGGMLSGKYYGGATPESGRLARHQQYRRFLSENSRRAADRYVELAQQHQIDAAQMAIAYLLTRGYVSSVLVGATSLQQLQASVNAADVVLPKSVTNAIDKIHLQIPNPCP